MAEFEAYLDSTGKGRTSPRRPNCPGVGVEGCLGDRGWGLGASAVRCPSSRGPLGEMGKGLGGSGPLGGSGKKTPPFVGKPRGGGLRGYLEWQDRAPETRCLKHRIQLLLS